jgi:PT repeat
MDNERFDLLAKSLSRLSRRSALKAATGLILGGALATDQISSVIADRDKESNGHECEKDRDCRSGVCNRRSPKGKGICIAKPKSIPTPAPTKTPKGVKTATSVPQPSSTATTAPTSEPTSTPRSSQQDSPNQEPTLEPTAEPTLEPTVQPTLEPTAEPTLEPTAEPTLEPTAEPTLEPTLEPTAEPTTEQLPPVASCVNMGWKRGLDDWSCPDGYRMPGANERASASTCVAGDDQSMFSPFNDIGISVGGCGCDDDPEWCTFPSIDTMRGRMCGDRYQLHICLTA